MSKIPDKIAIVLPSLKFGGAEKVSLNLAKTLTQIGIRIDILVMSYEGEFIEVAQEYASIVNLKCDRTYKLPIALLKYIRSNSPDVILCNFWKLNLCACLAGSIFPRTKLLLWEHSPPSETSMIPNWLYSISASLFYRLSDAVITVSDGVKFDILHLTVGLQNRIHTIHNPIFPPASENNLSVNEDSRKTIVWVGRLDEPKNPELALQAFESSACNDYRLIFVGDGPKRQTLEQLATKLDITERVEFTGFISEPYSIMSTANILLLTSDREGLPTVIIEALYCGLAIIATDCGPGISTLLDDGKFGEIVKKGDAVGLGFALNNLTQELPDPELQRTGAESFRPEKIREQFLALMC